MPDPKKYSDKNEWMDACMHQTRKVEGKPQDQSVAICLSMWHNKDKKKKTAADNIRMAALDMLEGIQATCSSRGERIAFLEARGK